MSKASEMTIFSYGVEDSHDTQFQQTINAQTADIQYAEEYVFYCWMFPETICIHLQKILMGNKINKK